MQSYLSNRHAFMLSLDSRRESVCACVCGCVCVCLCVYEQMCRTRCVGVPWASRDVPPAILIDEPCTRRDTHIRTKTQILLQTVHTDMLMHMILSYICIHKLSHGTPTQNTHKSTPGPWERDTSTLQLDTAWDEHITLWQIEGMGERRMGWKQGGGKEISILISRGGICLACQILSLLFHSLSPHQAHSLSLSISSLFLSPNLHLCNQQGPSSLPQSLSSLHLPFLIIFLSCTLLSTSLLLPQCRIYVLSTVRVKGQDQQPTRLPGPTQPHTGVTAQ